MDNEVIQCTIQADEDTRDGNTVHCTPAVKKVQAVSENTISPLVIVQAPKGRGRPRTDKRAGKPWLKQKTTMSDPLDAFRRGEKRPAVEEVSDESTSKKRRGRPPKKLTAESCNIFLFNFNDPVKKNKKKIGCPECSETIHELCWKKDRLDVGLIGCNKCNA